MKLNVQENLKNMEMYFCEVLGYRSYRETNTPHNFFYNENFEPELLVLETTSPLHVLKNIGQERLSFPIQDVLAGKAPLPAIAFEWFMCTDDNCFWHPCIVVAVENPECNKLCTDSGIKMVYFPLFDGNGYGESHHATIDYFLYCYDRKDRHFLDIPQETVDRIEDYLRAHGREIYDCC